MVKEEEEFIVNYYDHHAEDQKCTKCFGYYPVKCQCGGLIHAEFGGYYEGEDPSYWLYKKCSKCDNEYKEID